MHFEDLTSHWNHSGRFDLGRPWRWLRFAPVTSAYVILCLTVFSLAWLFGGSDLVNRMFGSGAASVYVLLGQWWTLWTCAFVHETWGEVLTACTGVLLAGVILESRIGAAAMFELLLWTSFAAAAASVFLGGIAAGAMLALNGILGGLVGQPGNRRGGHILSPQILWPLLVIVVVQWAFVPEGWFSMACCVTSLLASLLYGMAFRQRGEWITLRLLRWARSLVAPVAASCRRLPPVTVSFVLLSLSIFTLTWWAGGADAIKAMDHRWGTSVEILGGEWWRLFTGGLIPLHWNDLWSNGVAILVVGAVLEPAIGSLAMLGLLVVSTFVASLASLGFGVGFPLSVSPGSFAALFGLLGAALAHPLKPRKYHVLSVRSWLPLLAVFYLWSYFEHLQFFSFAAYVAALLAGVFYGAALRPRGVSGFRWTLRSPRVALAVAASLLMVSGLAMDSRWKTMWHAASAVRADYFGDRASAARHYLYVERSTDLGRWFGITEAARFHVANGDSERARTLAESRGFVAIHPQEVAMLATLLCTTEPVEEHRAELKLLQSLEFHPGSPVLLNALARLWVNAKDEALRAPRQAIGLAHSAVLEDGGRTPEFMETLARAHYACGNDRQALQWMHDILRLDLGRKDRKHYEGLLQEIQTAITQRRASGRGTAAFAQPPRVGTDRVTPVAAARS